MAAKESDEIQRTCALLIGSGKCHRGPGKVKVSMKGGIKRSRIKNQDQEGAWAETDLSKMQDLLESKRVAGDDITKINYKERNGKKFANGKNEIITRIEQLFEKDGKYYILYYTGHGDPNGAWVFPVTRIDTDGGGPADDQTSPHTQQGSFENESGNDLVTSTPGSIAHVEVHESIEITESDSQVSATVAATEYGIEGNRQTFSQDTRRSSLPQDTSEKSDNQVKHKPEENKAGSRTDSVSSEHNMPDTKEDNEFIEFKDIIELWKNARKKQGRKDCFLMIISDCCHAGKWVQELDSGEHKNRSDICIQAACHSSEICKISKDQQSSEFTRYFVEAHSLSFAKKVFLAVLDHAFVLNIVSIVRSKSEYSPISSRYAPFGQIEFYDSFDEMYLSS